MVSPPPQPHVLREYAVLADGERGAVVGPRGDIVWLCAPRWDSPSVFSALIGGRGSYTVTPSDPFVWGGHYEEGSLIWRSRWVRRDAIIECREALGYPPSRHGPVVLRRVQTLPDQPAAVTVWLEPRADYDEQQLDDLHRHGETGPPDRPASTCAGREPSMPGRTRSARHSARACRCPQDSIMTWSWRSPTSRSRMTRSTRTRPGGPPKVLGVRRCRPSTARSTRTTPGTATQCCAE